ncbi:MAG: hypothetical protein GF398_02865 [Chitinivibrionales bacterium]|nr:hypothetical protein [Chitinivibrionales bacterium]
MAFVAFVLLSVTSGRHSGVRVVDSLFLFGKQMLLLVPFAFILIGLFEVWIPRRTVERYLGSRSGFGAYLLAIGLAGTTVGGLYAAFPFAYAMYKKGAALGVIFTYLACAGICRIPMTVFEASFLGIKFTLVRLFVSLPLVVAASWIMGAYLHKRNYAVRSPEVREE